MGKQQESGYRLYCSCCFYPIPGCFLFMRTKGKFMTNKTIVIIGSSIAGLSAAEAARAQDPACDIIILSEDSFLPYYRQRLC